MSGRRVMRFGRTERVYHWVQALPYLVLLGSGALLFAPAAAGWLKVSRERLVLVHKAAGLILPAGISLVLLFGDRPALLANGRRALRWGRLDVVWFWRTLVRRPRAGEPPLPAEKFNSGQKLHLLAQMVLIPVLLVSGIAIWLRPGALLGWFVHSAAFLGVVPLLLGHLYMSLLHPAARKGLAGIFSGYVDADWARHHHPLHPPPPPEQEGRAP